MSAVNTDIAFVERAGGDRGCGCFNPCQGGAAVFRSVWDRLCNQLFGLLPIGEDGGSVLPDIEIWKGGVARLNGESPFTFTVVSDEESAPKASDIIVYKGKYYVIGAVDKR